MLLEVMIGMMLFLIGIVGIIGLQAASMKSTTDAKYRTEATYLANSIIGKMWGNPANISAFALPANTAVTCPAAANASERDKWVCDIQRTLPNASSGGGPEVVVNGTKVTITVRWRRDTTDANESVHNHTVITDVSSM